MWLVSFYSGRVQGDLLNKLYIGFRVWVMSRLFTLRVIGLDIGGITFSRDYVGLGVAHFLLVGL